MSSRSLRRELEVSAWTLSQPTTRLAGNAVDLSAGGALLWLPDLSPLAISLDLTIAFPREALHVTAEVRWCKRELVGVQFQHISPADQARLVEFLRQTH